MEAVDRLHQQDEDIPPIAYLGLRLPPNAADVHNSQK